VRVPKHTLKTYRALLTVAKAKRSFVESQRIDEASVCALQQYDAATELGYGEFLEAIGRCGLLKYEDVEQMQPADRVTALVLNVLGRMDVQSVLTAATLVRAPTNFNPRHDSQRLPGESRAEHEQWLSMWQATEASLSDLHGFPLWLKDVHNMLHVSLPGLRSAHEQIAAQGGRDFELDLAAWQQFARSAASHMSDIASDEEATETAEIVFDMTTSTIDGLPRLTFQGFLTALPRLAFGLCNPHFGQIERLRATEQAARPTRVKPVPWALLSLLDALGVHAE
jgi:hypothetical protein